MSNEPNDTNDLHDRVLDRALHEVLGCETPPDLSEQILGAASTSALVTPVTGDEAMNSAQSRSRHTWLTAAVAASMLVVLGSLLFLGNRAPRQRAQTSTPPANSLVEEENLITNRVPPVGTKELRLPQEILTRENFESLDALAEQSDHDFLRGSREGLTADGSQKNNRRGINLDADSGIVLGDKLAIIEDLAGTDVSPAPQAPAAVRPLGWRKADKSNQWGFAGGGRGRGGQAPTDGRWYKGWTDTNRFYSYDVQSGDDLFGLSVSLDEAKKNLTPEFAVPGIVQKQEKLKWERERLARKSALLNKQLQDLSELDSKLGTGPDASGDRYTRIYENPFIVAEGEKAVSTFSIDVDTASYANTRKFLLQSGQLPPPDAVRLEELINYFDYDYSGPTSGVPFASHVEVAGCPWQPAHRLVRIGIKGHEMDRRERPKSNLVFLIDVSGSMDDPAKLPLLVSGMKLLTRELGENDRVAIVVYASSEGLALPSTRGDQQDTILAALERLNAGGSTAGGAGIELAYKIAQENFIQDGVNRVILATDGDFNVGTTSTPELERMAEANAKETGVFLTVLGFGSGNLNDAMMEKISGKGNGNYHYVDNQTEARKVLVEEMTGTLVTIAKDVKIQIEFNPAQVAGYRLLGYENRMLATEDFNDDTKDAGEIGAGHTVTALYEIVPAGNSVDMPGVDPLKYQQPAQKSPEGAASDELLTLKIRYKKPDGDKSTKLELPITDAGSSFAAATDDFKFASAVASFGMLLRNSRHQGQTSYNAVLEIAEDGISRDPHGYRAEFLQMVRQAKALSGE